MKITEKDLHKGVQLQGDYYVVFSYIGKIKNYRSVIRTDSGYICIGDDSSYDYIINNNIYTTKEEAESELQEKKKQKERKKAKEKEKESIVDRAFYKFSLNDFKKALRKRYKQKTLINFAKELTEGNLWSTSYVKNEVINTLKSGILLSFTDSTDRYIKIDSISRMEEREDSIKLYSGNELVAQTSNEEIKYKWRLIFSAQNAEDIKPW